VPLIYAIDVGTRKVAGVVATPKDGKLKILAYTQKIHLDHSLRDGEVVDIPKTAKHISEVTKRLEEKLGTPLESVALAAAGKNLRTVEHKHTIPLTGEVTEATLQDILMEALATAPSEQGWLVGYSVREYKIDEQTVESPLFMYGDTLTIELILTYLPKRTVYALTKAANLAGLKVSLLTLEPIASLTSTLPERFRLFNIGVVDVGGGTTDIAIVREGRIIGYGSTDIAGDELTEVIASTYLLPFSKAERVKIRLFSGEKQVRVTNMFGEKITITREDILNIVSPTVEKIASKAAAQILNIAKKPAAIILVGGAAHTPGLEKAMASAVGIPTNRIGIKYPMSSPFGILPRTLSDPRWAVALGILLLAFKSEGVKPINIKVNNNPVSIPTPKPLTVKDALELAGIKLSEPVPITLMGQLIALHPQIFLNGQRSLLNSRIHDGDSIYVESHPTVKSIIEGYTPKVFIKDKPAPIEWKVLDEKTLKPVTQIDIGGRYIISPASISELISHLGLPPDTKATTGNSSQEIPLTDKVIRHKRIYLHPPTSEQIENKKTVTIRIGQTEKTIQIEEGEMVASILSKYPELVDAVSKGKLVSIIVNGKPATFTTRIKPGDSIEINTQ